MKKASRSLFYKEKESISLFLGEGDSIERDFISKLWKRPFMQELNDASVNILRLFNNACYICTLVYEGDYPLLDLKEYEKIAIDGHDDPIWTNHIFPATMALVVIWLNSRESQTIMKERGQQKNIEDLCSGICVSLEENKTLTDDCVEDFRELISQKHLFSSGFVNEKCFLRRPLAETVEDRSVKFNDIMDSLGYLVDVMKNPYEFAAAFGPDSNFAKEVPKEHFDETEKLFELWKYLDEMFNQTKENPIVIEQAFNVQTGLPCFTSRQMGILLTAVGRLTEKDNPPGKTTLGAIIEKIGGYRTTTAGTNMKGSIPKGDTEVVAAAIESKFPNLAAEVRKV